MKKEVVGLREFARRKNVNLNAVQAAIKSKRIKRLPNGKIDWESQSKAWDKNKDPSKVRLPVDEQKKIAIRYEELLAKIERGEEVDYNEAKTVHEVLKGALAGLELGVKRGELIEISVAAKQFEKLGTYLKTSLQAMPARLTSTIAGATKSNPHVIRTILEDEVYSFLMHISTVDLETIMNS